MFQLFSKFQLFFTQPQPYQLVGSLLSALGRVLFEHEQALEPLSHDGGREGVIFAQQGGTDVEDLPACGRVVGGFGGTAPV
jgi:hypothetical protein